MRDATQIVIILDRSGSMEINKSGTIEGFNSFLKKQKELPGEARIKLIQFSTHGLGEMDYQTTFDTSVKEAPYLNGRSYIPNGGTPLLDAQGRAITELGKELSALPDYLRPSKVLVVTITDGEENSSREYSSDKIKSMIRHQTDTYNWDFVYLGANQDAVAVGGTMGIISGKTMTYNISDPTAYLNTFSTLSRYAGSTRSATTSFDVAANSFAPEERDSSINGKN